MSRRVSPHSPVFFTPLPPPYLLTGTPHFPIIRDVGKKGNSHARHYDKTDRFTNLDNRTTCPEAVCHG